VTTVNIGVSFLAGVSPPANLVLVNEEGTPRPRGGGRSTGSGYNSLVDAIELWAEHWNDDPKPFVWHKTAAEILEKVRRGRAALAQVNSATHH
jgi:hypothetical protein